MRYFFVLLGFGAFIFWLFFPKIFKWWVSDYLIDPPISFEAYTALGPIGDIFGVLTALFTSLTLFIVLYSAYLQWEANKDVREAMEKQLEMASISLEKQLNQAKILSEEALSKQALHHEEQLLKAEKALAAQEKEAKDNVFSNNFFNLLNYKEERLKSLYILQGDKKLDADTIFYNIQKEFQLIIKNVFASNPEPENEEIITPLFNYMRSLSEECNDKVLSYLSIYISLINTIKNSHHDSKTKWHFTQILCDSIHVNEQIVFFAISPAVPRFKNALNNSFLFGVFYSEDINLYAKKFHERNHFWSKQLIAAFSDELKDKNPA